MRKGWTMDFTYRVADRDWQPMPMAFRETEPYNYVIMDGFLEPEVCTRLHAELLAHPGWTKQTHDGRTLYSNQHPDLAATSEIARQVMELCPSLLSGYDLVDSWALLYPEGASRQVHSDVGALTLNIWMTPDECNLDPSCGGLVFYDVKRREPERHDEDVAYLWSEQYLNEHKTGRTARVSYRWNRALLFDARTFHRTDEFRFTNTCMGSHRLNYSLTFDAPDAFERTSRDLRHSGSYSQGV